jgi:hypothetical protein
MDQPARRLRAGYWWEFEKDGESGEVDVTGPMIFGDADLMITRRSRPRSDLFF